MELKGEHLAKKKVSRGASLGDSGTERPVWLEQNEWGRGEDLQEGCATEWDLEASVGRRLALRVNWVC